MSKSWRITPHPQAYDNKGLLGQGRDAQVIAGRIRHLQQEIEAFRKALEECEIANGLE